MRLLAAIVLTTLCLAPIVYGEEKAPQCLDDKIQVQKLTQENADLAQRIMQLQFATTEQAKSAAKAEQARLEALLPKPVEAAPQSDNKTE